MTRFDLLVRGGTVVTPDGVSIADVAVSDGGDRRGIPRDHGHGARGDRCPRVARPSGRRRRPCSLQRAGADRLGRLGNRLGRLRGRRHDDRGRDAPQRPSADPRWSVLRRQAQSGRGQLPCRLRPLGRADACQSGAHGRAGGTRRHRFQGVHVELRHRRFPGGRRRHAVRRDATCGGARACRSPCTRRTTRSPRHWRPAPSRQGASALATTSPRDRQSPRSRRSRAPSSSPRRPGVPCMSSTSAPDAASPRSPRLAPAGST